MSTLYVSEQGVQVHQEGQRLLVKRGQEVLQDIPMIKVDRVVLMGKGVSITTPTLFALTKRKVGVYYLNSQGKYIVRTVGEEHRHSLLRHAQARMIDHPQRPLEIARLIVNGKVSNQRVLVQRHAEGAHWARSALALMDQMRRQVDSAHTMDELRGLEGMAAKEYFQSLRALLRPPSDGQTWGFDRRAYYPPTDPINALFSFGYTLLLNDLVAACHLAGLDPALGIFHAIDYNKPALALDLEEEFRPIIVDSIVLTAINRPIFKLGDFEVSHKQPASEDEMEEDEAVSHPQESHANSQRRSSQRTIYLKEAARKKFISLYEARVNEQVYYPKAEVKTSYRRIFELQAYQMAQVMLGEINAYQPFTVR